VAASSYKKTSPQESASAGTIIHFELTSLGSHHMGSSLLAKWVRRRACGACNYFHVNRCTEVPKSIVLSFGVEREFMLRFGLSQD
jgi:hypothetical protein